MARRHGWTVPRDATNRGRGWPAAWARCLACCGLAVIVVMVVAGCGGEPGRAPTGSPTSVATSASSSPATATPSSPPTSSAPGEQTLSGVIIEGIRPTCRILQTQDRRYALTGPGTDRLLIGQRVVVTGTPRPELVSPCGSTFVVATIGSAAPSTSSG